jgi:7-carboxy-7-deazaguanine synthase
MEIKLVKNGIFPITRTADGVRSKDGPETSYDFPGTVQGEGKLVGIPVLFIRTSGCNLRCTWSTDDGEISICDTPYSSHYPEEVEMWDTSDVISTIRANCANIRHVVISGGEPTLQRDALIELAKLIKTELKLHITLETNGVLYIQELSTWIDLFSISPKLASSEPTSGKNKLLKRPVEENYIRDHKKFRRNLDTLQKYINACMNSGSYYGEDVSSVPSRKTDKDFQLKFVISHESDMKEIKTDFLDRLSFVDPEDVVLMPLGESTDILAATNKMAASLAVKHGFRFTPRLQIDLYGNRAGT